MKKLLFLALCVLSLLPLQRALAFGESPFTVEWPSSFPPLKAGESFNAEIQIYIPAGHYIYTDKTEVEFMVLDGLQVKEINYPKGEKKEDIYSGETVEVYNQDISIPLRVMVPEGLASGVHELAGVVRLQGCTPKLCLRPEERNFTWQLEVAGQAASNTVSKDSAAIQPKSEQKTPPEASWTSLLKTQQLSKLLEKGWLVTLFIVFLAGVLTSFTPCVWPLIPVTLLVVGVKNDHHDKRNIILAASLVLGMVVMYALLGVAAVALGKSLGFLFQSKFFLGLLVIFFVLMALSLFGLYDIQLPPSVMKRLERLGGAGARGAFLAGMATGIIASPCVGPVIGAILAYVSAQQSYFLGLILLAVFGLGMGLFFFVLALGSKALSRRLKGGTWMVWMKRILGLGILLVAIWYALSLFGVRMENGNASNLQWLSTEPEVLQAASSSGKPVMVDFFADWCAPCHELDSKFFSRSDIADLSENFVMWRVDASNLSETLTSIEDKYEIVGYPSIIFLSPEGEKLEDYTVTSYEPELLEANMREVLDQYKK